MNTRSTIFVKNVYYMLAYAFRSLRSEQYEPVGAEDFEHVHDLFAAILSKGIAQQVKQGLRREYLVRTDDLTTVRGRIDLPRTAALKVAQRMELGCEFDELSPDPPFVGVGVV